MSEHHHSFAVDAACDCGVMISQAMRAYRDCAESAERERDDARNLVAEVAQGVTHHPQCPDPKPCVRCDRDAANECLDMVREVLEAFGKTGVAPMFYGEAIRAIARECPWGKELRALREVERAAREIVGDRGCDWKPLANALAAVGEARKGETR